MDLIERAKKYIADCDKARNLSSPITNFDEIVNDLVKFWEPTEEDYQFWAKKMMPLNLKEGTSGFKRLMSELIAYWKETPYDEDPIVDYNFSDSGERRGFVANRTNRWFRKPADWKTKIEIAKRMK